MENVANDDLNEAPYLEDNWLGAYRPLPVRLGPVCELCYQKMGIVIARGMYGCQH